MRGSGALCGRRRQCGKSDSIETSVGQGGIDFRHVGVPDEQGTGFEMVAFGVEGLIGYGDLCVLQRVAQAQEGILDDCSRRIRCPNLQSCRGRRQVGDGLHFGL